MNSGWPRALALLFLLGLGAGQGSVEPGLRRDDKPHGSVEWSMINVNAVTQQADAHLIRFSDGTTFLIDVASDGELLVPYLKKRGILKIDKVIITHAHPDHYGGLPDLLESEISIGQVIMNLPDKAICDGERPWGCDYEKVQALFSLVRTRGPMPQPAEAGQVLYERGEEKLKVLYAFDGRHTPIGVTDINDTSLIILLSIGGTRALFTGDLNQRLGKYLAEHGQDLEAQLLKVPHHGTEGLAPNAFFDRVHPKVALIPSPRDLWMSDRSKRTREYFQSHGILTYVNGREGTITAILTASGYQITSDMTYLTK